MAVMIPSGGGGGMKDDVEYVYLSDIAMSDNGQGVLTPLSTTSGRINMSSSGNHITTGDNVFRMDGLYGNANSESDYCVLLDVDGASASSPHTRLCLILNKNGEVIGESPTLSQSATNIRNLYGASVSNGREGLRKIPNLDVIVDFYRVTYDSSNDRISVAYRVYKKSKYYVNNTYNTYNYVYITSAKSKFGLSAIDFEYTGSNKDIFIYNNKIYIPIVVSSGDKRTAKYSIAEFNMNQEGQLSFNSLATPITIDTYAGDIISFAGNLGGLYYPNGKIGMLLAISYYASGSSGSTYSTYYEITFNPTNKTLSAVRLTNVTDFNGYRVLTNGTKAASFFGNDEHTEYCLINTPNKLAWALNNTMIWPSTYSANPSQNYQTLGVQRQGAYEVYIDGVLQNEIHIIDSANAFDAFKNGIVLTSCNKIISFGIQNHYFLDVRYMNIAKYNIKRKKQIETVTYYS